MHTIPADVFVTIAESTIMSQMGVNAPTVHVRHAAASATNCWSAPALTDTSCSAKYLLASDQTLAVKKLPQRDSWLIAPFCQPHQAPAA